MIIDNLNFFSKRILAILIAAAPPAVLGMAIPIAVFGKQLL
jgi:hypothetical protein